MNYVGQVDNYVQAHGIGRLWNVQSNPPFMYEGQFGIDGQPHGFGRYIDGHSSYTGYWSKGMPHGSGWYTINNLKKTGVTTKPM